MAVLTRPTVFLSAYVPPPTSPEVVSYNESSWNVDTTPRDVTSLSWNAGDIIVVAGLCSNNASSLSTPTNANLTFSLQTSVTGSDAAEAESYIWTATAASSQTSQTISVVRTATAYQWGFAVWVVRNSSGVGVVASNQAESALSLTVEAGSAVIYAASDWNATSAPSRTIATGSGTATERADNYSATNYAWYTGDWVGTSAGTFGFGVTSYTGWKVSHSAIELKKAGITITNKYAANVNSTTTQANLAAATADCGTVTTGAILLITQSGTGNYSGTAPTWVTPTKSSGTATVGTATLIGQEYGAGTSKNETTVWRMPVTSGGTLVLSLDDDDISYGYVLVVDEVTGYDTITPVAGAVTVSDPGDGTNQVGTASNSTLGATPVAGDVTYVAMGWDTDPGTNTTEAGTGFTERADLASNYSLLNVSTRTGSTSTTVVWPTESSTGLTYSYAGVAFIIKKAT